MFRLTAPMRSAGWHALRRWSAGCRRSARSLLIASLALAAALDPPALAAGAGELSSMAERTRACTACHGEQGKASNQGYFPRIAGKPAAYLDSQLRGFRDGRRHYPLMRGLLENLDDDYLREIAGHFAALDLPYPPPQLAGAPVAILAKGRDLVQRGDATRGIPACAACHGHALTGVQPAMPGLLGLPRDYLNAQLGAWKAGQRRATAPDCMAEIAGKLEARDIEAVSTWLASQPMPAGARPAERAEDRPPLRCGTLDASVRASAPAAPSPAPDPMVRRGEYLARAGNCLSCHTGAGAAPMSGGRSIETPFGTVYGPNLTPDPVTGLGAWTAQDFWNALHEGRSRDGRLLNPSFPYTSYTRVTREDSDAIFAWLRSLPPVHAPRREHALRFPFNTQWALAVWRTFFFTPQALAARADRSPEWNRGAYLVQGLGHCDACHAPRNLFGATREGERLAGGPVPMQSWYAPSLASSRESGLADWPIEEIVRLLRTGRAAGASVIGPMAEVVYRGTQHLDDADLRAIATYLKALPQQPSPARASGPAAQPSPAGAQSYRRLCADCHGEQGEGRAGAYPALAGNRAVAMDSPRNLIAIVLAGGYAPSTRAHPRPHGMPPFGHVLDDQAIATLLTHVRASWGAGAPPVSAQQVQQARSGR